jgi:WD40 repeat protein
MSLILPDHPSLPSLQLVSHLKEHTLPVRGIALYDDNFHAISCSRDRSFLCWDLRSEKKITSHKQRMGGINGVALSKDQTMVLTVGQERRVTSWDLRDQNPVNVRDLSPNLGDEATTIALSNDGTLFATAGTAMLIKLWDIKTLELLAVGEGHSGFVNDLKFSPDDRQIVSVGEDGNVFVWNCYK